jgi:hypothetical protein
MKVAAPKWSSHLRYLKEDSYKDKPRKDSYNLVGK